MKRPDNIFQIMKTFFDVDVPTRMKNLSFTLLRALSSCCAEIAHDRNSFTVPTGSMKTRGSKNPQILLENALTPPPGTDFDCCNVSGFTV